MVEDDKKGMAAKKDFQTDPLPYFPANRHEFPVNGHCKVFLLCYIRVMIMIMRFKILLKAVIADCRRKEHIRTIRADVYSKRGEV